MAKIVTEFVHLQNKLYQFSFKTYFLQKHSCIFIIQLERESTMWISTNQNKRNDSHWKSIANSQIWIFDSKIGQQKGQSRHTFRWGIFPHLLD